MNNILLQSSITILTVLSLWCLTNNHKWYYRWGTVAGLLVQPLWIVLGYMTNSWSLYIICPIYFFIHFKAFYRLFIEPWEKKKANECWLTYGCKGQMVHSWSESFCPECHKSTGFDTED